MSNSSVRLVIKPSLSIVDSQSFPEFRSTKDSYFSISELGNNLYSNTLGPIWLLENMDKDF